MSMSDTLGDTLTRIRNAQKSGLMYVRMPYSKEIKKLLDVLIEEGFASSYSIEEVRTNIKALELKLKYSAKGEPIIRKIERVSKPGKRIYSSIKKLQPFYNGMGIYIVSTSQGVMSDRQARRLGIGGEVMGKVF